MANSLPFTMIKNKNKLIKKPKFFFIFSKIRKHPKGYYTYIHIRDKKKKQF